MLSKLTLCKHSSGIYYIWYEDEHGCRQKKSTGCKKKGDASSYLTKFIRGDVQQRQEAKRVSLSRFQTEYLEYSKQHHKLKTYQSCRSALREFQRHVGNRDLTDIGIRDMEQFMGTKQVRSAATAKRLHLTLGSAFETARRWGYVPKNLWREVAKPKVPEKQKPFMTKHDLHELISTMEDNTDFRDLVLVGFNTGMRLGELRHLRFDAVDFQRKVVTCRNTAEFTTKSGRERTLPLNPAALEILIQRQALAKTTDLVFPNERMMKGPKRPVLEGVPMGESWVSRTFKAFLLKTSLSPELNFHSLRHSFGSNLVLNGTSLYAVQKLLGHASSSTTQAYAHLMPDKLMHVVDGLSVSVQSGQRYEMNTLSDGRFELTPTNRFKDTVTLSSLPNQENLRVAESPSGKLLIYPGDYFPEEGVVTEIAEADWGEE